MADPNGHSKAERVSNKVGKMGTGHGRSGEEVRRMESRVLMIRRVMRSISGHGAYSGGDFKECYSRSWKSIVSFSFILL